MQTMLGQGFSFNSQSEGYVLKNSGVWTQTKPRDMFVEMQHNLCYCY